MSLSWRSRASIFLGPTRVHVARAKDWRGHAATSQSFECTDAGGTPWQAALDTLGRALGAQSWKGVEAAVTVSNHFARFALVPDVTKLRSDEEYVAAARHYLHAIYGERAERWRVALGNAGGGMALAAGIEPELVDGITATLTAAGATPVAIEPFLATAFNLVRHLIGRSARSEPTWLAVAEPGRLCLAHFDRGAWRRVRSDRVRTSLAEELPAALERSRLIEGMQAGGGRVLFVSGDDVEVRLAQESGWSIEPVRLDHTAAMH